MDILLLAKCDQFLHTESSVASLASYFNPHMTSHFLQDEKPVKVCRTTNWKNCRKSDNECTYNEKCWKTQKLDPFSVVNFDQVTSYSMT